jgi:hypothetical protein
MKNNWNRFFATLALLALLTPALYAQTYSIDWHKVAGGGGTSTGTNGGTVFSVSGTIGQPDSGKAMTGGVYSLTGGFWSIISVVQTVNSPLLSITHTGSASVVVSWPSSPTGFTLQQTSNLANTNSWTATSYVVTTNGATESITIAPPNGSLFFRLFEP